MLAQQAQFTNNLVFRIGHPMPPQQLQTLRAQVADFTNTALELKQQARMEHVKLQNAARISDKYNSVPIMPNYNGIVDPARHISAKDLQAACKVFDPDDPKSPDFGTVWNNLRYFGRDNNFQEINYRQALSVLLMGDAKELYHSHRDLDAPFDQTLTALYQAYAKPRSIQDDRQALNNIVRQPGESIAQCVARGEIQIDKQQLIHPVHKWPVIRETLVHEMVANILLPKTQAHLQYLEHESIETTGQTCNIYRLITELDKYELKHGLRPKVPMKPTFHSAHTGLYESQASNNPRHPSSYSKPNLAQKFFSNAAIVAPQKQNDGKSKGQKPSGLKPRKPRPPNSDKSNHQKPKYQNKEKNNKSSRDSNKPNAKSRSEEKPKYKDGNSDKDDNQRKKKPYQKNKPDHKNTKKPSNKYQQESSTPGYKHPLVTTGKLKGKAALLGEEDSFYANFGNKPCVCTPMDSLRKSKN